MKVSIGLKLNTRFFNSGFRSFVGLGFVVAALLLNAGCGVMEKKETQLKIRSTVYQNNEKWSYCYKKALDENSDLKGEMSIQWDVSYRSGQEKIQNVSINKSNVQSETLVNCMKQAVTTMKFNLPERNQKKVYRVSFPFVFDADARQTLQR